LIDVIIPVYKGLEETRRCVESVLHHAQREAFAPVVVDDASPEPEISAYLDRLAHSGRIELLRNESNLGFVQTVNRAMELHRDRDVVLLNSDTEVANDWLDRMVAAASRNDRIATVTPFSNNATICSYPFEGWSSGLPGKLGLAALDQLFAGTNAGQSIDIPTAVGFCMYIRRRCLDEMGLFDNRYGRGYGEENDFCMRSAKSGWRHVLAADVFVFHEGGVSFSDERFTLVRANARMLVDAHPEYNRVVHEFIVADPARRFRDAIDLARANTGAHEAAEVLRERSDENARLLRGLLGIEKIAAERDSKIHQLSYAVEHATTQLSERERIIRDITAIAHEHAAKVAAHEQEIERLRAGLATAESLAFSRLDEIDRMRAHWVWRLYSRFSKGERS
jgi:GT2 family glycosyltransferase